MIKLEKKIDPEKFIGHIHIEEDDLLDAILKSRPLVSNGEEYINIQDNL